MLEDLPRPDQDHVRENDRCAAGCGRTLGTIADELSMSVKDLGPLACQADKTIRISSTCTVFVGAELRDLLNLGEARAVMDLGALHGRAMKGEREGPGPLLPDDRSVRLRLGSVHREHHALPRRQPRRRWPGSPSSRTTPEQASSICAVLAETDVINMVSPRHPATPDIIRGIHESIGQRLVKLLSALKADSPLVLTVAHVARRSVSSQVIRRRIAEDGLGLEVKTHEDGVFAGAIGAALWAGWRHHKLLEKSAAGRDEARTAA